MTLWLTLLLAGPSTWQDAFAMEKSESVGSVEATGADAQLSAFVRANQSASFDEALVLSIRTNDASGVLGGCQAAGARTDARFLAAQNRVAASLTCTDRSTCTELFHAVHELRASCLDLSTSRWGAGES